MLLEDGEREARRKHERPLVDKAVKEQARFQMRNTLLYRLQEDAAGQEVGALYVPDKECRGVVGPDGCTRSLTWRKFFLLHVHSALPGAHQGQEKMLQQLKALAWWPKQEADCRQWVRHCQKCRVVRGETAGTTAYRSETASGPIRTLRIDLVRPIAPQREGGEDYVMTVIDMFTYWLWTIPLKSKVQRQVGGDLGQAGLPRDG